jgi:hypothetical protein
MNKEIVEVLMTISQVFIFILGASSIYLVGRNDKISKYGFIIGLMSQPFWLYSTSMDKNWGMFALCLVYTFSWINGIYNHFYKKQKVDHSLPLGYLNWYTVNEEYLYKDLRINHTDNLREVLKLYEKYVIEFNKN